MAILATLGHGQDARGTSRGALPGGKPQGWKGRCAAPTNFRGLAPTLARSLPEFVPHRNAKCTCLCGALPNEQGRAIENGQKVRAVREICACFFCDFSRLVGKTVAAGLPRHRTLKSSETWRRKPAATASVPLTVAVPVRESASVNHPSAPPFAVFVP